MGGAPCEQTPGQGPGQDQTTGWWRSKGNVSMVLLNPLTGDSLHLNK